MTKSFLTIYEYSCIYVYTYTEK